MFRVIRFEVGAAKVDERLWRAIHGNIISISAPVLMVGICGSTRGYRLDAELSFLFFEFTCSFFNDAHAFSDDILLDFARRQLSMMRSTEHMFKTESVNY